MSEKLVRLNTEETKFGEDMCMLVRHILRMTGAPSDVRISILTNLVGDELLDRGVEMKDVPEMSEVFKRGIAEIVTGKLINDI